MVYGKKCHGPYQLCHDQRQQERIETESPVYVIIKMKLQLLALEEVYFDQIVSREIGPGQYYEQHLPGTYVSGYVDSIYAACEKKERKHYHRLIQIKAGVQKFDLFAVRPFFGRSKKAVESRHVDYKKNRDKYYEIFLKRPLSYSQQESNASRGEHEARYNGKKLISCYPESACGRNQKKQNHGTHGKSKAFEKHVQRSIEKYAGNNKSYLVFDLYMHNIIIISY